MNPSVSSQEFTLQTKQSISFQNCYSLVYSAVTHPMTFILQD